MRYFMNECINYLGNNGQNLLQKKLPEIRKSRQCHQNCGTAWKSCGIALRTDFGNVTWASLLWFLECSGFCSLAFLCNNNAKRKHILKLYFLNKNPHKFHRTIGAHAEEQWHLYHCHYAQHVGLYLPEE